VIVRESLPDRRWLLVLWLVPLAVPLVLSDYLLRLAILSTFVVVLAVSLDILFGYTGQASLAHAAFYGVGAYLSALLVTTFEIPVLAGIATATVVVGVVSLLVGWPVLRASGLYFSIITLAFSVVVFEVLNSWREVTGGSIGLRGVPELLSTDGEMFLLVYAVLLAILLFKRALIASYVGKAFLAIREDEELAAEMGIRTHRYKTLSFVLSSTIAGLAGALFAHYSGFLAPSMFTTFRSFELFVIVVVGGAGTFFGPIVGGVVLTLLPELLREVDEFRQLIYGLLLILIIMFFPEGIVGTITSRGWARRIRRRLFGSEVAAGNDDSAGDPAADGDDGRTGGDTR
jgi:branched-chain amino acid transport system permease protein